MDDVEPMDGFTLGLKDAQYSGWYNWEGAELATGFPVSAQDVVVDVGCGDGGPVNFCARLGAHVILADVDAAKIAEAQERLSRTVARKVESHITDADPLPLADGAATRVICMEVLEHVPEPPRLMRELFRIGAPGALYLISVPGHVHEHIQKELAPPQYFEPPNHIRVIDPDAFTELILGAGLNIERRFSYSFYWAMWWTLFWECDTPFERAAEHPLLKSWALTWQLTLDGKDGGRIQKALNELMPKNQVIIARKPH